MRVALRSPRSYDGMQSQGVKLWWTGCGTAWAAQLSAGQDPGWTQISRNSKLCRAGKHVTDTFGPQLSNILWAFVMFDALTRASTDLEGSLSVNAR